MKKRPPILDREAEVVRRLVGELKGVRVILFGSRARGSYRRFSDLDICLKGARKIPLILIGSLREAFEESTLPYVVDIVDYHRLPDSFRKDIDVQGVDLT